MLLLNLIPNKMVKLIMKLFVYGSVPVSDNTSRQSNGWVGEVLWTIRRITNSHLFQRLKIF